MLKSKLSKLYILEQKPTKKDSIIMGYLEQRNNMGELLEYVLSRLSGTERQPHNCAGCDFKDGSEAKYACVEDIKGQVTINGLSNKNGDLRIFIEDGHPGQSGNVDMYVVPSRAWKRYAYHKIARGGKSHSCLQCSNWRSSNQKLHRQLEAHRVKTLTELANV